jgi:hypothetical protein
MSPKSCIEWLFVQPNDYNSFILLLSTGSTGNARAHMCVCVCVCVYYRYYYYYSTRTRDAVILSAGIFCSTPAAIAAKFLIS